MPHFSWPACPPDVRAQVEGLLDDLRAALGEGLLAVYLHGSLAMGCFNPARSDLDVLVVTAERMAPAERAAVAEVLLRRSGAPAPIEVSFLSAGQVRGWSHPAPFDLHYSEDWRERFVAQLASGELAAQGATEPRDHDLAAHVTVARARGVALHGPPPASLLPPVPAADYADSIVRDVAWAVERAAENPVYLVLNGCRVLAYLVDGAVLSKDEGGAWGLGALPEHRAVIAAALAAYRGGAQHDELEPGAVSAFAQDVAARIGALAAAKHPTKG